MKVIINNDNFGEIGTAVFYRFNKYIPLSDIPQEKIESIIQDNISDKVQYRGNKEKISYEDFSEYNFSYLINKYKFNDKLKINFLDNFSKEIIGKNTDVLERFESIIFPTLSNSNEGLSEDFFGSGIISNYQTFILLSCSGSFNGKNGYYKIELYEDSVDYNNDEYKNFINYDLLEKLGKISINKPALSIYMGPENLTRNNSASMYYDFDSALVKKEDEELINAIEYGDILEEITKNKMIGITISPAIDKININLSYRSWIDSSNPNRNLNKFFLRNDEFFSNIENINIIDKTFKEETGFILDSNSGNLIGTIENNDNNCPILKRKKRLVKKIEKNYSPYKRYSKGDIINFFGEEWVSLSNNNCGNNPYLSLCWARKDSMSNYLTSRVSIMVTPINSGYSSISGLITIIDKNISKSIVITEYPGYELDEENPCYYTNNNPLPKKDYIISKNVTTSGITVKTLIITNWEKPISSGYLYINLIKIKSKFKFVSKYLDEIINYNDWSTYFQESNFKLNSLTIGNIELSESEINSSNGQFESDINESIFFDFLKLNKYVISNISYEKIINNSIVSGELSLNENNNVETSDIVNYTSSTYILNLIKKTFKVVTLNTTYIEVSELLSEIEFGETCSIKFYSVNEFINVENILIKDENSNEVNLSLQDTEKNLGESKIILSSLNDGIYLITIDNITSNISISFEYLDSRIFKLDKSKYK